MRVMFGRGVARTCIMNIRNETCGLEQHVLCFNLIFLNCVLEVPFCAQAL